MLSTSNLAMWIILLPFLGFLHNAFAGLIWKKNAKKVVSYVAPGVVLLAFGVALMVVMTELPNAHDHRLIGALIPGTSAATPWINLGGMRINFELLVDPLSLLMAMIVTGVGGLIHVYATGYMAEDPEQPRFFTYFNLFITMMLILVLGGNFLLMFVGWEGVGTCSYLLISFSYKQSENAKAGNKAFIVNRVGDLGFALGMMLIWSVFGTLSYFTNDGKGVLQLAGAGHAEGAHTALHAISVMGTPVSVAVLTTICVLLFVGAMGKSAQIPLWVWLPDAMAGPTPVSALIHAATMVTSGIVMVTRCSWLFSQAPQAMQLVGYIGLATAFVGATIGLVQNDIKRVLAFSTVSQLGYMFLACGVGNYTAGMFHVTTHAIFKALLFLGSGAVIHSMLGEQDMRKMGGLRKKIFKTWLVMWVGTYAIAGVPGLSGFFSKDEILHSALSSPGNGMFLYGVGLAIAFMTAFYMNRLMHKTFGVTAQFVDGELPHQHHSNFDDHDAHGHDDHAHGHDDAQGVGVVEGHGHSQVHESPASMMIPLYVLAALSVVFGAWAKMTGAFEKFLEPVAPHMVHGEAPITESMGYIISACVAIAGLTLAHVLYRQAKVMERGQLYPAETKTRWEKNPLHPYTFLLNKWWWDVIYNGIFLKIGGIFAILLWKVVDAGIINGTIEGLGWIVGGFSRLFRKLQTGYVRNYALAMLLGVLVLVLGVLGSWTIAAK
ncbi:MAG: NADH-quinone oxidoreductase subunit L [Armatimonadetes bacterium]|nr:NADH-quinone oxidoreductase subunit L [Armatimonadota bacterium]